MFCMTAPFSNRNLLEFTPLEFETHQTWLAITAITLLIVVFFGAVSYKFLVGKVRWQLF